MQYFSVVFAIGFVLGTIRTIALVPALGEARAVLVELPIMLAAAWWVCGRRLQRTPLRPSRAAVMGSMALVLLLLAEAALSILMFGRPPAEHLALYDQPAHFLGLIGQILFGAFPWAHSLGRGL
jgi:hypothetical protein